jgi:hypothetical protein
MAPAAARIAAVSGITVHSPLSVLAPYFAKGIEYAAQVWLVKHDMPKKQFISQGREMNCFCCFASLSVRFHADKQ